MRTCANWRRVVGTLAVCLACATPALGVQFGVIGDYGSDSTGGGANEAAVANLVTGWNPDFIVTVGDNNYNVGSASTIDQNIGQYYHNYIGNYTGGYGAGSPTNRFFPVLGNHDWGNSVPNPTGANPYLNYFTLPGPGVTVPTPNPNTNERYYTFVQGPVQFFMVDSDANEPDGTSSHQAQAQWLRDSMRTSTATYKIVVMHHAPYSSSSNHGSQEYMQWPFKHWGATAVFAGHDHDYERLKINDLSYFVTGAGGNSLYGIGPLVPGSQFTDSAHFGAMRVTADPSQITFEYFSTDGVLRDTYSEAANVRPVNESRSFQQGVNGYNGAHDTMIRQDQPNTSFQGNTVLVSDLDDNGAGGNQPVQDLIRFEDLFGPGPNQIPLGATILSANLSLVTGSSENDQSSTLSGLYRMLGTWNDTDTWNSLTGGISTDGSEAAAIAEELKASNLGAAVNFDVTATLQAWANDPSSNFGWALINSGVDGWRWNSSEAALDSLRPMLDVTFAISVLPEPSGFLLLAAGGLLLNWQRRRRRTIRH